MDAIVRHWHVLYTRPRFEKKIYEQLLQKHIESYLPIQKIVKRWSDRKKTVEEPLFTSYVFVHTDEKERLATLQTVGVVRCVSFGGKVAIVPDIQIENLKRMLGEGKPVEVYPTIPVGARVKIARGPLYGIEGVLADIRGSKRFALTIDVLRRSVLIDIGADSVEALDE